MRARPFPTTLPRTRRTPSQKDEPWAHAHSSDNSHPADAATDADGSSRTADIGLRVSEPTEAAGKGDGPSHPTRPDPATVEGTLDRPRSAEFLLLSERVTGTGSSVPDGEEFTSDAGQGVSPSRPADPPAGPTVLAAAGQTPTAHRERPLPTIDGYEILGELGRGGMGVVYRAREVLLNRLCVLKMILAGAHADAEAVARFLAEAEAVARLQHPNIVQIHHIGEADGLPYFELEYIDGGSLDRRLDGTPWKVVQAAELVETLARGVSEAHRLGIVHRDLKPANVLHDGRGSPQDRRLRPGQVADEGLAG